MDTKFCTSCQAMRALEGGERRVTRGVPRWVCRACMERKSESIYKSQRADTRRNYEQR
jgi:hypothetical protein